MSATLASCVWTSCAGNVHRDEVDAGDDGPSTVVFEFRDAWGTPIVPSRCELLISGWNSPKVVPLPTDGYRLRLHLDRTWAQGLTTGSLGTQSFLLIEAPGHAPILSEAFSWIGQAQRDEGRPPTRQSAELKFPDGTRVAVERGQTEEVTLRFRHPERRFVRLISRGGEPVPDVPVRSHVFWPTPNRCGLMETREVAQGRTDSTGRIEIPDGDWLVGLKIEALGWTLESPRPQAPRTRGYPLEIVVAPAAEEVLVYLQRKVFRPLRLEVTEWGLPARGRVLHGNLANISCGATWGHFAKTDFRGSIARDSFCAEDYNRFWFEDSEGNVLWQADPREMDLSDVVRIDLGR